MTSVRHPHRHEPIFRRSRPNANHAWMHRVILKRERTLQISDRQLMAEVRSGSQTAFEVLMRRYERLVFRVAYGYTHERESALDVTQNVFIKVHRKADTFRADGEVKGWILRIASNESLNWMRSFERRAHWDELDETAPWAERRADQEDRLIGDERRRRLLDGLGTLNPKHRLAVILRYFEEMPLREIASVLDCSEGVVKNILFRSLRRMRGQMTPLKEGTR